MRRKNPLQWKPPGHIQAVHRGGKGKPEDYLGVHTTSSMIVAAAYAQPTTDEDQKYFKDAFPVILELDVEGLSPKPDYDAILKLRELFEESYIRDYVVELLDEGKSPWDIVDYLHDYDSEEMVSTPWELTFMYAHGSNPAQAILDCCGEDAVVKWAYEGKVPTAALMDIVDQQRYMVDFNLDRLVRVYGVRRWWPHLLDEYQDQEEIEKIEVEFGYSVTTIGEFEPALEVHVMYESGNKTSKTEFHGTSSVRALGAFEELEDYLEEDPFPIMDPEED